MGRYYKKSDYADASSSINNSLPELVNNLTSLSSMVSNFYSIAKSKLSGEAYDIVLARLDLYSKAFKYLGNSIDIFVNNAVSANNAVINAIGGDYNYVSEDELDDLKKELVGVQRSIIIHNSQPQSENNTDKSASSPMFSSNKNSNTYSVNVSSINDIYLNTRYARLNSLKKEIEKLEDAINRASSADSNGVDGITDLDSIFSQLNDCYEK